MVTVILAAAPSLVLGVCCLVLARMLRRRCADLAEARRSAAAFRRLAAGYLRQLQAADLVASVQSCERTRGGAR